MTLDDDHLSVETSKPQPPWINNGVVTLSIADKAILEGKECLTDSIVNAAQTMLSDQFSMTTGFQSTNTGLCMTFTIEPDEFVQILHDGLQSLLLVVSTQKSRYSTASMHLVTCLAALLATKEHKISVHFMDVQMQAGGSDCGLFAIALIRVPCANISYAALKGAILKCSPLAKTGRAKTKLRQRRQ